MKYTKLARSVALVLALVLTAAMLPMAASADTELPALVDESQVTERLDKLIAAIGDGTKHFTVSQKGCTKHKFGGASASNCTNCLLSRVIATDWLKKATGFVPDKYNLCPTVTYKTKSVELPFKGDRYTSIAFAKYVGWYLFAQKSSQTVTFVTLENGSGEFSEKTLALAKPGDVLIFGTETANAHSGVFVSYDSEGVTVFDSNYSGLSLIKKEKIKYTKWPLVTINRAENYSGASVRDYSGSDYTTNAVLAEKLDGVFAAYKPGSGVWPGMESVDGAPLYADSSVEFSKGLQYARWAFYKIFGCVDAVEEGESGKYAAKQLLSHEDGKKSRADVTELLKSGLQGAAVGSHLRINRYRSFILLGVSDAGATVLDADWRGAGNVEVREMSYAALADCVKDAHSHFDSADDLTVFLHEPESCPGVFDVTLDAAGGTLDENTIRVTNGSEYGTLPEPSREGFKFTGWFTEETGGTAVTPATKVTATEPITLYAHWEDANAPEPDWKTDGLEGVVAMKIGEPKCSLDGTITLIDPANDNVAPIAIDQRTMLPIRFLIEFYGGTVGWDGEKMEVTCALGERSVTLVIDSRTATVDGQPVELDVPATAINERTLVPVRFVSENLGLHVGWDGDEQLVVICSEELPEGFTALPEVQELLNALKEKE